MTDEVDDGAHSAKSTTAGLSIGSKFWPDGSTRCFPGNTILSPIAVGSIEWDMLGEMLVMIQPSLADNFVLLPESSWHMTVFELLCEQVREPSHWSTILELDAPLVETDAFFAEVVATVQPPSHITMIVTGVSATDNALFVTLDPANEGCANELRRYRDELANVTGISSPDHDRYQFHITLGYTVVVPVGAFRESLERSLEMVNARFAGVRTEVGLPVLTYFEDMTLFSPGRRRA